MKRWEEGRGGGSKERMGERGGGGGSPSFLPFVLPSWGDERAWNTEGGQWYRRAVVEKVKNVNTKTLLVSRCFVKKIFLMMS